MIRACTDGDIATIDAVINHAAQAYKGVIPADCWHEPYMPRTELLSEMAAGVQFWGWHDPIPEDPQSLLGVMGIQQVRNPAGNGEGATLIRHAYVLPGHQSCGIGAALLRALIERWQKQPAQPSITTSLSQPIQNARRRLLVGTWAAAEWAIRFYERHGFRLLPAAEKDRVADAYYKIPLRQRETSVVLAYVDNR
jgi:GNAT superfamily N-acetyltransferase